MKPEEFRRYTDLLSVVDMLRNRRIALLSPEKWADQNDSHSLEIYRRRAGAGAVLAFCVTEAEETYHHWQVFAGHAHGACVVFDKAKLLERIARSPSLVAGPVRYESLAAIQRMSPLPLDQLPFVKREAFRDEKEYRVIAVQPDFLATPVLNVAIDLSVVKQVIFSPLAARSLLETMKDILHRFDDCDHIHFNNSRLINNLAWRRAIARSDSRKAT